MYPGYGVEIKVSDLDLAGAKLGLMCHLSRKVPALGEVGMLRGISCRGALGQA